MYPNFLNLPQFLKSTPIWIGTAAVGVGGSGVAIWQVNETYERNNPTAKRILEGENYVFSPIKSDLGVDEWDLDTPKAGGSNQCFDFFFPGAEKIMKHNSDNRKINENEKSNYWKKIEPTKRESLESQGCSILSFSHKYTSPNNKSNGYDSVFKAEITVKNENIGLALWVVGHHKKSAGSFSTSVTYFLLFMEKEGNDWKSKGGHSWADSKIYQNNQNANKSSYSLHISSPEKTWLDTTKGLPKNNFKASYFGFWESKGGEGSGIFQDIGLWAKERSEAEILGRKDDTFTKDSNSFYGYEGANRDYQEKKWLFYYYDTDKAGDKGSMFVDITETLNSWYGPFKNQKGKWRNLDEYCKNTSGIRNLGKDSPDMKNLKGLCYRAKK